MEVGIEGCWLPMSLLGSEVACHYHSSPYSIQGAQNGAAPPTAEFVPPSSSSVSATGSMWNEHGADARLGPVKHHWFYLRSQENYWIPFSLTDSAALENAVMSCPDVSQQVLIHEIMLASTSKHVVATQ